ncbi:hypothetical protein EV294_101298 [Paenibacillus sp. BK033]|uniref:hypothetical protein n=1 Tax=Paenibacillus sp. BK033 TaxID=2512133 RepID=UPI001046732B|nr:hypothetical protein [Paenibacillus sp. BK033]TCN00848.1 hypothetical protein EV294_101298 [Paenibacillus sp. BK033]
MSGQTLSDDEYSLIRDYIILPFVKNMVKNNIEKIKAEGMTLSDLFVKANKKALVLIEDDINASRRNVGRLKMQITKVKQNDDSEEYEVRLRGYVHKITLQRHVARREMATMRDAYIARVDFK